MSIRGRLGRFWDRMTDDGLRASPERVTTRQSHLDKDPQTTLPELPDKDPGPILSPRTLHKAASTTFQAFSDSLRSKAQAFYTRTGTVEQDPPHPTVPETPQRSSHRSALWSSVRSRGSRSDRRAKLSLPLESDTVGIAGQCPTTPTRTNIGPAPKLELDLPNLSLRDAQDDGDDGAITPVVPIAAPGASVYRSATSKLPVLGSRLYQESRQLWPSPYTRLAGVLTGKEASDELAAVFDANPDCPEVGQEEALQSSEDGFSTASTTTPTPTASTARTSISGPQPSIQGRGLLPDRDFKGTYFKGMVVPIAKRTLTSIGVESSLALSADQTAGQEAGKRSQKEPAHVTTDELLLSFDAESEDISHSPTASMGPRGVWDEARAARQQRYDALQSSSLSSELSTDEDSDFGSKLKTTHHRTGVPTVGEGANHDEDKSRGAKSIFRRGHKSSSPLKFRRKRKVAANETHHSCQTIGQALDTIMSEPQDAESLANGSYGAKETQQLWQTTNLGEDTILREPHDAESSTNNWSIRPEPITMNIEDYMQNRQLRLGLHAANADVLLYEPSNAENPSTAQDRIFITFALDPNDELDRRRINTSYLRRAHMAHAELKANPIPDDDSDSPLLIGTDSDHESSEGMAKDPMLSSHSPALVDTPADSASSASISDLELDSTAANSWNSSPENARGRSSMRLSPATAGRRTAGAPAESSKHPGRYYSSSRRRTPSAFPNVPGRYFSPSNWPTSVTPESVLQEHVYLEAQYERLKELKENGTRSQDGEVGAPAPRQRLADISMVERRNALLRRASYERCCQVVYDLEKLRLEEEAREEKEDGYSAATFDGGLSDKMAPPA
ncbi:MAG: hypothetical protein Q9218_002521 [Villophora microphyllina]